MVTFAIETVTLGVHFLLQSLHSSYWFTQYFVPQGFVPAINALAWYYEQFEQDYKRAAQLWEQADLLECPDAAFNLGVIYSQGLYPGKAADQVSSRKKCSLWSSDSMRTAIPECLEVNDLSFRQFTAYQYYLKSAERGHIRGPIYVADTWTTGIPGRVNRRPADAVLLATSLFIYFTPHIWLFLYVLTEMCLSLTAGGSSGRLSTTATWAASCVKPWTRIWRVTCNLFLCSHSPHTRSGHSIFAVAANSNSVAFQQVHLTVILHDGCWVGVRSCPVQCGISMRTTCSELFLY